MPPDRPSRPHGLRRLAAHPRTLLALKASVAATAAWLTAEQLPGTAQDYSFYAPFGAVVTMYPAVARSAVESFRALGAILLGAALGITADLLLGSGAMAIAAAVLVGVTLAGQSWIGSHTTYVPVAAVFVLLIGQGAELRYAAAYGGLFLMGALFSIAINAAFPVLPTNDADAALCRLRTEAATHLRSIGDEVDRRGDADTEPGGRPDRGRLGSYLAEARTAMDALKEAAPGNRRARHRPEVVAERVESFEALERAALLVDDLYGLSDDEPWGTTLGGVPDGLREPMADALRELATAITDVDPEDHEPGARTSVDTAVQRLTTALHGHARDHGPDPASLLVSTVITTLRRTLSALTPPDRIQLSRSTTLDESPDA